MKPKTIVYALFAAFMPIAANGYYGFDGDLSKRDGWLESTIVPLNAYSFRMRQPDGTERVLYRDLSDPRVLRGEHPWIGELRGAQTVVMTQPGFDGGQTGFLFVRGRLRKMILDGREYQVTDGKAAYGNMLELWPEVSENEIKEANERNRVSWEGRLRLWYVNPNHAGMMVAEAVLLFLALFACSRGVFWKILSAPLVILCLYGLVRTGSRGGMVALLAGVACFAVFRLKALFKPKNLLCMLLALAALAAFIVAGGVGKRFTAGLVSEGYTDVSRIPIWKEAPRMMVSSPSGWGWSRSGDAYINWFQPADRFHVPGGFLNTHLNVLVDCGWFGRILYSFAWAFALAFLAAEARRGRSAFPFAVCAAFFTGSVFNPLGHALTLWIVPAAAAAWAFLPALSRDRRGFAVPAIFAAVVAVAVPAAFAVAGAIAAEKAGIAIRGDSERVVANGSESRIWVVDDGYVLDGGCKGVLGKDVRGWYGKHRDAEPVGFARSVDAVPDGVERLVLAGKACDAVRDENGILARLAVLREIVLVSPAFGWKDIPNRLLEGFRVKLVAGSFAAELSADAGRPPEWVRIVPGCELYIPGWLRFVVD